MQTANRWGIAALLVATALPAQRAGHWISNGTSFHLIDAYGSILETRSTGALSTSLSSTLLRGSGNVVASFGLQADRLIISNRTAAGETHVAAALSTPGIALALDRHQQVWVIRDGQKAVSAYDYQAKQKRSIPLPNTPGAMCLTTSSQLWVCQDGTPGAALSWFDTSIANPTINLVTLPASFGTASQILAEMPKNGKTNLWLLNKSHNRILKIDDQGQAIATHTIGKDPSEKNKRIFLDNKGELWIHTDKALYQWQAATQSATHNREASSRDRFSFDSHGRLWVGEGGIIHGFTPDNLRPKLRVLTPGTGELNVATGLYRAMIIDPTGDADRDGESNLNEIKIGTDPYDASSSRQLDLRSESGLVPIGSNVELSVLGNAQPSVLLIAAGGGDALIAVPGINGTLRFSPMMIVPITIAVPFTGKVQLPVPNNGVFNNKKVSFQAFTTNGTKLSNHVSATMISSVQRAHQERFTNTLMRDSLRSGGTWKAGAAHPGKVGGIGIHGSFDHSLGNEVIPNTFVWNTDNMTIPASHTLFGQGLVVTNGKFDFTDFTVPAGVTVKFEGSHPAVIRVRGEVHIFGSVTSNGQDVPKGYNGKATGIITYTPSLGQDATSGGAGGGAGGRGAIGHTATGPAPQYNGQDGDDLSIPGTSGYSGLAANTGGRGSAMFPASGLNSSVSFNYGTFPADYASQTAAGGAGGGYLVAGGVGTASRTFSAITADLGPSAVAGIGMGLIPLPAKTSVLDHFLFGGSGGGGSGSHPLAIQHVLLTNANSPYPWHGGGAGAGGGGALAFVSGGGFELGSTGRIEARGGNGDDTLGGNLLMSFGNFPPPPGGAGSGGSIIVQTDGALFNQQGVIDVRGGISGKNITRGPLLVGQALMEGGAGAPGFVRIEQPAMTAGQLGQVNGITPGNEHWSSQVHATTDWSAFQTKWYKTGLKHAAVYDYYELRVRINGTVVTYSDSPSKYHPANLPGQPVKLYLQGAMFDGVGNPTTEPSPWREKATGNSASLSADQGNGYRFMVMFDPTSQQSVTVENFAIWFH